jgi:hypothetical protein
MPSQVCNKSWNQRAEQKVLKNLQFDQKSQCKVGAKAVMVSEEINTIKMKSSTLHWDTLRASQELTG